MDRYFTREMMGPECRHCMLRVPAALGVDVHPCCGPEPRALVMADDARVHRALVAKALTSDAMRLAIGRAS